ncbi:hypothetical protein BDV96DRAFT_652383 [Lophiotrema nucula]|uniref:Uncharacterized protein n=1 Tax=Lophiotrema nucula TaxID=690887 RepID=A0A6A5YND2_9PLEO|nr:hypothetical protein BDV96DRAFT_652383 [Lophiotrema nucula]
MSDRKGDRRVIIDHTVHRVDDPTWNLYLSMTITEINAIQDDVQKAIAIEVHDREPRRKQKREEQSRVHREKRKAERSKEANAAEGSLLRQGSGGKSEAQRQIWNDWTLTFQVSGEPNAPLRAPDRRFPDSTSSASLSPSAVYGLLPSTESQVRASSFKAPNPTVHPLPDSASNSSTNSLQPRKALNGRVLSANSSQPSNNAAPTATVTHPNQRVWIGTQSAIADPQAPKGSREDFLAERPSDADRDPQLTYYTTLREANERGGIYLPPEAANGYVDLIAKGHPYLTTFYMPAVEVKDPQNAPADEWKAHRLNWNAYEEKKASYARIWRTAYRVQRDASREMDIARVQGAAESHRSGQVGEYSSQADTRQKRVREEQDDVQEHEAKKQG